MMDIGSWQFWLVVLAINICGGPPRAPVDTLLADIPALTSEAR